MHNYRMAEYRAFLIAITSQPVICMKQKSLGQTLSQLPEHTGKQLLCLANFILARYFCLHIWNDFVTK